MPQKKLYGSEAERKRAYRSRVRERKGCEAWTRAELLAEVKRLRALLDEAAAAKGGE